MSVDRYGFRKGNKLHAACSQFQSPMPQSHRMLLLIAVPP